MFKKDPLQIITFQTYGTPDKFYARGRGLEDEDIDLSNKGMWKLLVNTWKRFETDEVRHVPISVKLPNGRVVPAQTGAEGYFQVIEEVPQLEDHLTEEGWLPFTVSFEDEAVRQKIVGENRFPGEMLIPAEDSEYAVISDIDDTILHTGVVSSMKWRVIFNTAFKRPESRSALAGAPKLYHQFHRGSNGLMRNPIFYVSHSPWNLYRYLEHFLRANRFPKGPILLRSFSSFLNRKNEAEKPQKQREIINILKTYPKLKFILIGDSGEHDADIYIEIAEAFPDRILAIYLRSVKHRQRMLRVKGLFENYKTTPVLLAEDSEQIETHALEQGFITRF